MLNINSSTPLYDLKGDNVFTIQMNSDQSESSTGDSNPIGEISRNNEDLNGDKIKKYKSKIKKNQKKLIKNQKLLNKKTKRNNSGYIKNNKYKIIINIFKEFKSSSSLYQKFPQFYLIEKNVKKELYSSSYELARDVRDVFSNIFISILKNLEYNKYNQVLTLSELFEKIYNKYDNKSIIKKCKIVCDEINKMKKEVHKTEVLKNREKEDGSSPKVIERKTEISIKKYKDDILAKIKKLNNEQKKGIINIISNNFIDKYKENNIIEFNINKIPLNQLKELDKYINECINIKIINQAVNCQFNVNKKIDGKKQNNNILEDEDISSFLSDEEYEDDDLN